MEQPNLDEQIEVYQLDTSEDTEGGYVFASKGDMLEALKLDLDELIPGEKLFAVVSIKRMTRREFEAITPA